MADSSDNGDKSDELKALILLFARYLYSLEAQYTEAVTTGTATPYQAAQVFGLAMMTALPGYHARAAAIGRQGTGATGPYYYADDQLGAKAGAEDAPYVDGFVSDLAADKYLKLEEGDVSVMTAAIKARCDLYANRLRSTAHEAFVFASPDGATFVWYLDPGEGNHCADCERLAKDSPYTVETLPTYPGSGATRCRTNCQCWLERDDQVAPFAIV